MSRCLDTFRVDLCDRLTALVSGIGPVVMPLLFSDFLKEALDERAGASKDRWLGLK